MKTTLTIRPGRKPKRTNLKIIERTAMNTPTTISYSGLTRWNDCPTSWVTAYIHKTKGPVGDAARRGNDFDELVAHRLGLQVYERDGKTKKTVPVETNELKRMLEAYQQNDWSVLNLKPEQAPHTQTKVSCTPEQWSELAEKWGSSARIDMTFNGFIDFGHTMADGVRKQVTDLKTSTRHEYKTSWPFQVITYAAILGYDKAEIHLISLPPEKEGGKEKEVKCSRKEFLLGANRSVVRNCLNWVAFSQSQIKQVVESGNIEELPRLPGYHCYYCPLRGPDCKMSTLAA